MHLYFELWWDQKFAKRPFPIIRKSKFCVRDQLVIYPGTKKKPDWGFNH